MNQAEIILRIENCINCPYKQWEGPVFVRCRIKNKKISYVSIEDRRQNKIVIPVPDWCPNLKFK